MKFKLIPWRTVGIAFGVLFLLWIALFPLGLMKKIQTVDGFISQGAPGLVRLDMINQGLFFRFEITDAYRGLYQPVAQYVSTHLIDENFNPNSYEVAASLSERPEILCAFRFVKTGLLDQINGSIVNDHILEKTFSRSIGKWRTNQLEQQY